MSWMSLRVTCVMGITYIAHFAARAGSRLSVGLSGVLLLPITDLSVAISGYLGGGMGKMNLGPNSHVTLQCSIELSPFFY